MKKKVGIIVQKLNGGGAERVAANLSILLNDRFDIHLFLFDAKNIKYTFAGQMHDVELPADSGVKKIVNVFKRRAKIMALAKQYKIETMISLMDGANLVNALLPRNVKKVASVHNNMSSIPKYQRAGRIKLSTKLFMKFIEHRVDTIVAVSEGVKEDLCENFKIKQEKLKTIYNAFDEKEINDSIDCRKDTVASYGNNVIGTMGRLTEQKGQWHLIRAFAHLLNDVPDAELVILGDGPLESELKQLAKELNIESKVHFLGFVQAPHAYITNCKVFVLSSIFEGFGNVLVEAMLCGVPCVSTDCKSGPREILAPNTGKPRILKQVDYCKYGVLTDVGSTNFLQASVPLMLDELQLCSAMKELLCNEDRVTYYASKSCERGKMFSFETIAKEWEEII